jgi:hypothetical protein
VLGGLTHVELKRLEHLPPNFSFGGKTDVG